MRSVVPSLTAARGTVGITANSGTLNFEGEIYKKNLVSVFGDSNGEIVLNSTKDRQGHKSSKAGLLKKKVVSCLDSGSLLCDSMETSLPTVHKKFSQCSMTASLGSLNGTSTNSQLLFFMSLQEKKKR